MKRHIIWLGLIGLLSLFMCLLQGITVFQQYTYQLMSIKGRIYAMSLVAIILIRRLSPLITGMVFSAFTPLVNLLSLLKLKNDEKKKEEDYQSVAAINVISLNIIIPLFTLASSLLGIFLIYMIFASLSKLEYLPPWRAITGKDYLGCFLKSLAFAMSLSVIGNYQINSIYKNGRDLSRNIIFTIVTIMANFVFIFIIDLILTTFLY